MGAQQPVAVERRERAAAGVAGLGGRAPARPAPTERGRRAARRRRRRSRRTRPRPSRPAARRARRRRRRARSASASALMSSVGPVVLGQRDDRGVGRPRSRRPGRTAPRRRRPRSAGAGRRPGPAGPRGRTASSSRPIIVSSTIEHSSTTTTSYLSRLPRSWRNRVVLSGRQPSSRCRVIASGRPTRARSLAPAAAASSPSDRLLQPGRGLAGRCGQRDRDGRRSGRAWSASSASSRATVVVLPVPGPPVSTVVQLPRGAHGGRLLLGAEVLAAHPVERRGQRAPRRPPAAAGAARAPRSSAHLRLEPVVAVEVDQAELLAQHAGRRRAASSRPRAHRRTVGPGQVGRRRRRTVARSTQTEPRRTARTASATASSTRSSASPAEVADARWRRGRRRRSAARPR